MIVVVSDNGASGEGGPNGSVNEMKFANGVPDDLAAEPGHDRRARRHRRPTTTTRTAGRWRSTRRSRCGSATSSTAARATRASSRGRPGSKARGEIRDQYHHAIDIVPTILDVLGVEPPETIKGHTQTPFDGVSMREQLRRRVAPSRRGRRSSTRCSARARSGTRAGRPSRRIRRIAGWGNFNDDEWELYHIDVDRSEVHNLAAEQPDKLRELVNIWFSEAGANGAFPLDDRTPVEILIDAAAAAHRAAQPLRVLPGHGAGAASGRRSTPKNRSFVIGALVDIPAPGAEGVLFAHRLALRRPRALRQGQPAALRQQLRRQRGADGRRHRGHPDRREPDPVGLVREGGRGADRAPTGTLSLYHGDTKVGEGKIKTQLGAFAIAGSGLYVGRAQRRAGDRRLPGRGAVRASPAARSTGSRSTSAASRTSTSSARPRC